VIGSGAGGALTAATLAEAGHDVMVIEDGPWIEPDETTPYSLREMTTKYRHGGLNSTVGLPPIAFVEGRCVGGGTEVNSGLYHRLPSQIVEDWARRWLIHDFTPDVLARYAGEVEHALSISLAKGPVPSASAALARGAQRIGLEATEVPRAFRADDNDGLSATAVKQTMTRTFIPRAQAAGARIMPKCRALRLVLSNGRVVGVDASQANEPGKRRRLHLVADHVFVCAGATGTPNLLRRSGIRRNIGNDVKIHPMIKMAALFDDRLDNHTGVPMHQVRDIDPNISYGCSVSRPGYLALALGEDWDANAQDIAQWQSLAVYYACIRTDTSGKIHGLPALGWPILRYQLSESDLSRLRRALVTLGEMLFAAGATRVYPAIMGAKAIGHPRDLAGLWNDLTRTRVTLTAVHLFCGVKMGGDPSVTGADSFGRVWGYENLYVNDASLLPDAPGVNPQGSIMSIAARNSHHFLSVI
jgi:choline dehydrogenase-like flavoprotein